MLACQEVRNGKAPKPTPWKCALKLRQRLKTLPCGRLEQERDAWILKRTFFTVTARKFGHADVDKDAWRRVGSANLHAVIKAKMNVPCMDPVDGTLKLHMISGT
jgi:hypothetical protein